MVYKESRIERQNEKKSGYIRTLKMTISIRFFIKEQTRLGLMVSKYYLALGMGLKI